MSIYIYSTKKGVECLVHQHFCSGICCVAHMYGAVELVLQMLFVTVGTESKYNFLVCYNFQLSVSSSQLIDVCDVRYLLAHFQVSDVNLAYVCMCIDVHVGTH